MSLTKVEHQIPLMKTRFEVLSPFWANSEYIKDIVQRATAYLNQVKEVGESVFFQHVLIPLVKKVMRVTCETIRIRK